MPDDRKRRMGEKCSCCRSFTKIKRGVYAGIKVFNHLPEKLPSPAGLETIAKQNADFAKKSLKSQVQKYHEKITKPELTANKATRLQMDVKDLEKEVFRDIETRKKSFITRGQQCHRILQKLTHIKPGLWESRQSLFFFLSVFPWGTSIVIIKIFRKIA